MTMNACRSRSAVPGVIQVGEGHRALPRATMVDRPYDTQHSTARAPLLPTRMPSALVLIAILSLAACGGKKAGAPPPVTVTVAEAVKKDVPLVLTAIGTVQAYDTVSIKALVGGQIMRVHVQDGQDVKKGDPLFTIDPRPFQAALDMALARLARDRAQFASADAQARRYADLVQKDYVTKQQSEDATAGAEALAATMKSDDADVENARLNLAYCSIRAPIDGRLGNLLVREGNVVKANDTPFLVTLNQVTPVYVAFSVPEQRLAEIRSEISKGTLSVSTAFADKPETRFPGTLTFVDNAVDSTSGTILLKATFSNRDKALWPGQYVNVFLTLSTLKDAVVVPDGAIQQGQQGSYLYVVKSDMTAEMRPVVVIQSFGGETALAKGAQAGETVVTDGQLRLVPRTKVEIKTESAGGGAEEATKGDPR